MHKFLNTIGFGNLKSNKEIKKLLNEIEETPQEHEIVSSKVESNVWEYRRWYTKSIGILIGGEMDEASDTFEREYYFPFLHGRGSTSHAEVLIERRIEKEQYIGVCDDMRVGVSLIFQLQNAYQFMNARDLGKLPIVATSLTLSGLAESGVVLFPVKKSKIQEEEMKEEYRDRAMLLNAAKDGDHEAMETLAMEDINVYTTVSNRLCKEDVFSIVDTYFMPFGVECDQYAILGEILDIKEEENVKTKERVYIMHLNVNDMKFDVCIAANSLTGEPAIGRRLKSNIWLQGRINY